MTFEGHFGYRRTVITLYARLTRALLAIAKFLVENLLPADCAWVNTADYELLNSSACLPARRHDDGRATMHCARGHLVKLVRLVYGHSATTGRCHYLPADCVTHLVASGNEVTCVGLNRCDVYVTSRDHGRPIPGCQLPTNYIHALFQCIPGMRKASQLTIKPIRYSSSSS